MASNFLKRHLGFEEVKTKDLWMSLLAELFGTGFLVLVGCGSANSGGGDVQLALCFGLTVAIVVHIFGPISGGHVNPAVTAGMMVVGDCRIVRGVLYIVAQLVGSVLGALVLRGLASETSEDALGQTSINQLQTEGQGFGIELMITFVLVSTVFAAVDPENGCFSPPLMIGLSVTACHMWAIRPTGSSMNTARSFGPAVVSDSWDDQWVYWLGPIVGGILAGIVYKLMHWSRSGPTESEDPEAIPAIR